MPAKIKTGPRILPRADQEHLGRGPREHSPVKGALSGDGDPFGDGSPLPGGVPDNTGARGKFQHILEHFRDLQAQGPARGYYPEPTKRILIVDPGK